MVYKVRTCPRCPYRPSDLGSAYDPDAELLCCASCETLTTDARYGRRKKYARKGRAGTRVTLLAASAALLAAMTGAASPRDHGQWAQVDPAIHEWVDKLHSPSGVWCCHLLDGELANDVEYDMDSGRYRVKLDGRWLDVPDDAVITEPNKFGRALVWVDRNGDIPRIRCFLPGAGI